MEIADVLYGVAMEEEGISKIISVKLKDNMDENNKLGGVKCLNGLRKSLRKRRNN